MPECGNVLVLCTGRLVSIPSNTPALVVVGPPVLLLNVNGEGGAEKVKDIKKTDL